MLRKSRNMSENQVCISKLSASNGLGHRDGPVSSWGTGWARGTQTSLRWWWGQRLEVWPCLTGRKEMEHGSKCNICLAWWHYTLVGTEWTKKVWWQAGRSGEGKSKSRSTVSKLVTGNMAWISGLGRSYVRFYIWEETRTGQVSDLPTKARMGNLVANLPIPTTQIS